MEKITTEKIKRAKAAGQKIAMLTAYDFPLARILDQAGIDIVLVGDSLGNVALGYKNTLPVTLEEMLVHTRAVARAVDRAMVVADMPFGSFQVDPPEALANAIKLVKAGAEAVKIEGIEYLPAIKKIIQAGIPVMGHVGLTPQSVYKLGGYAKQGKDKKSADKILQESKALEKAGCFSVVLELVPEGLAKRITKSLKVPTIGIGAGPHCGGQVLVTQDLLGLSEWMPSFVKPKANLKKIAAQAVKEFIEEMRP